MEDQVEKYSVNNILLLDKKSSIKQEECEENEPIDNKTQVSETVLIIGSCEIGNYDKMKQYELSNAIKTEFLSCETEDDNMANCNVKAEKQVIADNRKMEFETGLYCEHCQVYYEDYCIKCGMLVHILNKNPTNNTIKGERIGLPDNILEIQNYLGRFGIFALKVIPEGVKFGPFTGFSNTEYLWKRKVGKIVNKDKTKDMNWMKYINPASTPFERNLLAFRCANNLYYQSICEIQKGDELLVHFGEEYENSLNKDLEVDFIPRAEHIQAVFACTLCCLGFSSISNLVKHKTICSNNIDGSFHNKELTQCSFCKIYLYQKEYFEHHMAYCSKNNDRKCVQLPMSNQMTEVIERKIQRRRIYKCEQCKYRTKYKGDLKNHTNQHCEVKMYKCGTCHRRFMTRESLSQHAETSHVYTGKEDLERSASAYVKEEHQLLQGQVKRFKCRVCEFRTKYKVVIKEHIKTKHLVKFDYKCEFCPYKTNIKSNFKKHIKSNHLKEFDYKCESCDYKSNYKSNLDMHMKTKHLQQTDYNCESCDYTTNYKSNFKMHMKSKHLKQTDYNCESCDYKTNHKAHFETHVKTKHLVKFDYKCEFCSYKSNRKSNFDRHIKSNHLKEYDYKCEACDYKTNRKADFEKHVKASHPKEADYKSNLDMHVKTQPLKFDYTCGSCDYETNRKPAYEQHIKRNHLIKFNYKCDFCRYKTNNKSNFERHIKCNHLKEFDYKCELCGYNTNIRSHLDIHVKTKHLVEFDYKCESCDYKTNYKANLDTHIKAKHLVEFEYKCESCDYKTNYKANLDRHVKTSHLDEVDYKCEFCRYKTNRKPHFELHVKTKHLKEFDHKCQSCDYKTNYKANLDIHVKTKHLQKFDYKCESCDYKTNRKTDFKKHVKTSHPKEFH